MLLERGEARHRKNRDGTMSVGKITPPYLAAEPRRLKSKRQALERQKLLRARTGSLYDFIPNPISFASVSPSDMCLSYQLRVREIVGHGGALALRRYFPSAFFRRSGGEIGLLQHETFVRV